MRESLEEAKQELKRAEHLLFVSLKYTRTIEVLSSILSRLLSFYDRIIDLLLKYAKEEKKLDFEVPKSSGLRVNMIKEMFLEDERILEEMDFYLLLRRIIRSEKRAFSEYRRHVALIVTINGEELVINIDKISEYYKRAQSFFEYIKEKYVGLE